MKAEVQKEHQWLQKLIGDWSYQHEMQAEPGKPAQVFTGTESVRPLGAVWVLCEGRGEMPGGGTATTQFTFGFDPQKRAFVGTFIASVMTYLWIYEKGSLDPAGKTLTLEAKGPAMSPEGIDSGKMIRYKDSIEFVSDDHRILRSQMRQEDGTWIEFLQAHYKRNT